MKRVIVMSFLLPALASGTVLIGDVDLNGIAYEGPDIIGCLNGLFHGKTYYTIDPDIQLMATDANEDGVYTTVEDYQYFLAVGQRRKNPGDPVGEAIDGYLLYSHCDGRIQISSLFEQQQGGAVFLNYHVPATTNISVVKIPDIIQWRVNYSIVNDTLKIIFHSFEGVPIPCEATYLMQIFYDGDLPEPAFMAAAGFDAQPVNVTNRLMADANTDDMVNVADAVYVINYVFKNGPVPDPLEIADANCDGQANVADAVYVINYVFKGGPGPCCP